MKIEEFIKKHKFYYADSDITSKNFPLQEVEDLSRAKIITIDKIDKSLTSEEVLKKVKMEKLRPANIYELMAWFDENKGEMKKGSWLIALGSEWVDAVGHRRVPFVDCDSDGDFKFRLGYFENVWRDDDAFLCFCDTKLSTSDTQNSQSLSPLNLDAAIKLCKENGLKVYKEC